MEATPFQLVGFVFSPQPDAERIDAFATLARRERAVVTAKNTRQATFVRFGTTDARLIALACEAVRSPLGSTLRFGFACSLSDRTAQTRDGVRVSSRALAQAGDLAAGARDGQVLLSPQLATLLADAMAELRTSEIHLPGERSAIACAFESLAARHDGTPTVEPAPADSATAEAALMDIGEALRKLAAQADAMQSRQADLGARHDALFEQTARTAERLEQMMAQVATLTESMAQLESRRPAVDEAQSRADGISHLLNDLQVNLEMLGEQRAVVDDVGERLARLDFTVQEAHNTLRALQRERELAERIEQGLKALRIRPGAGKVAAGR
ncbi:MAG TPA: hypothetical protein VML58_00655 [Burkholderiaceae bacterium]|nr:hypothetical protein [Burkholderiaceae bacterium]